MCRSGSGGIGGASACPTVHVRIVSSSGVREVRLTVPAPDDHMTSSPDCRVKVLTWGHVDHASGRPTVCSRIVPPPGVEPLALSLIHISEPTRLLSISYA